jgi:hypothetical protein
MMIPFAPRRFEMATVVELENVRGIVREARTMLGLRTAALVAIAVGIAVLAADVIYLRWVAGGGATAETPAVAGFLRAMLAVMAGGLVAGGIVALGRFGRLSQVTDHAEGRCPEIGLRMTTSLETPQMEYCPPAMRRALYRDTADRVGQSRWAARVTARPVTVALCGLAALLLAVQGALCLPWPGNALVAAVAGPAEPDPEDPAVAEAEPEPAAEPPFEPVLEIAEPGQDQWASKIDAIPVKVSGTAPHGFDNLRLEVAVPGGETVTIPLDPARFEAMAAEAIGDGATADAAEGAATDDAETAAAEATAWINLDEFPLDDFDVLTYEAVGDAKKKDGTTVRVASEMYFVQIRPFDQDVFLEKVKGQGEDKVELLYVLIEQQRAILRATSFVKTRDALADETPGHAAAVKRVETAQRNLEQTARDEREELVRDLQDKGASAEMIVAYDRACDLMHDAGDAVQARQWDEAIPTQHETLATLVDLLRLFRKVIEESEGKGKKKDIPKLEDDLLARKEEEQKKDALDALIQGQQEINREEREELGAAPPKKPKTPDGRDPYDLELAEFVKRQQAKADELARRQQALAEQAQAAADLAADTPKAGQLLAQASAAMQENQAQLEQAGSGQEGSGGQQGQGQGQGGQGQGGQGQGGQGQGGQGQGGQGQGGQGQGGQGRAPQGQAALAYLRQAAEVRRVEELERQAERLGQVLEDLARQQRQVEAEPTSADRQAEAAAELAAAGEQLGRMADGNDGPVQQATTQAAAAAKAAAEKFAGNEGRPADLDETMAAVAEAQKQSLGEAKYAAALLEEVGRLLGEVQRLEALGKKDPAKLESEAVEEWVAAFEKRRTPLEKQLAAAAGDQWDDTLGRVGQGDVSGNQATPTRLEAVTPSALDGMAVALESAQTVLRERLRLLSQRDLLESMQGQAVPREYRELVTAYFLELSRSEQAVSAPAAEAGRSPVERSGP